MWVRIPRKAYIPVAQWLRHMTATHGITVRICSGIFIYRCRLMVGHMTLTHVIMVRFHLPVLYFFHIFFQNISHSFINIPSCPLLPFSFYQVYLFCRYLYFILAISFSFYIYLIEELIIDFKSPGKGKRLAINTELSGNISLLQENR